MATIRRYERGGLLREMSLIGTSPTLREVVAKATEEALGHRFLRMTRARIEKALEKHKIAYPHSQLELRGDKRYKYPMCFLGIDSMETLNQVVGVHLAPDLYGAPGSERNELLARLADEVGIPVGTRNEFWRMKVVVPLEHSPVQIPNPNPEYGNGRQVFMSAAEVTEEIARQLPLLPPHQRYLRAGEAVTFINVEKQPFLRRRAGD